MSTIAIHGGLSLSARRKRIFAAGRHSGQLKAESTEMKHRSARRIVILTGAGISAESGVPTFRDSGGLWEGHRVEDVASPAGFRRNPGLVHRFYNLRRADIQIREPNDAHRAIARLQKGFPDLVTLITQNVDDLHERAGSSAVLHMHGELLKIRCERCQQRSAWTTGLGVDDICGGCGHRGSLRPDIVWFGEMPFHLDDIENRLKAADVFAAIGTSGVVYPAAGFVDLARAHGSHTVEFNLQRTEVSSWFDEHRFGPASQTVSQWVNDLLSDLRESS